MTILFFLLLIIPFGYLVLRYRHLWFVFKAQGAFVKSGLSGALELYEKAYRTGNMSLRMAVTYAYLLLKHGSLDQGEKVLESLEKRYKNKAPQGLEIDLVRSYLALVEWKRGRLSEAVVILEDLYGHDYKTAAVYGSLGYFLLEQNQLEKALILNLEARDYDSTDPVVLDNLALNYRLLKDLKAAEEVYSQLIPLDPRFPEVWYNYGIFLLEMGRKEEAKVALEKARHLPVNHLSTISIETMDKALESL